MPGPLGYVCAAGGVALASVVFRAARPLLDAPHASLLYLLVVAVVAYTAGAGPAVLASLLSFFSWNYFFIEPRRSLFVHDPRDLIALTVFLVVALLVGGLAGRAREEALSARQRERETAVLYEISSAAGSEMDASAVIRRVLQLVVRVTGVQGGAVLTADAADEPTPAAIVHPSLHTAVPQWEEEARRVLQTGVPTGWDPPGDQGPVYLPLTVGGRVAGVLLIDPGSAERRLTWADRKLILAGAGHIAVALERQRLAAEAAAAEAFRSAEEFRNTLLSSVSHDLRTPLASIKAAANSLLESGDAQSPDARRELLEAIDGEVDRLNTFVGALLDISRLEAGAWEPRKEWHDLTEIIGTVLGRLPEESASRVQVTIAPDVPLVPADEVQLGQALWNVLENALKFSPPSAPVEVEAYAAEPDTLRIAIADRGPGIPPGEEERIFQKFYRAAGDRRPPGVPGSGLGLAITRGVIEAHGGKIRALPRPGGGALFEISLPLQARDLPALEPAPGEGGEEDGR
ncbi:MAG: DUF4118 domain-containing protein [Armatimonadota bacterium]|nr:DUF4118 domain-containing protein [Armatimonadota bacterium]